MRLGDKRLIATVLNNIGEIYQEQSNYREALNYYQQSLDIEKEIGNQAGFAISLNSIGMVHGQQGDYQKALHYLDQALKIAEEIGEESIKTAVSANIRSVRQHLQKNKSG